MKTAGCCCTLTADASPRPNIDAAMMLNVEPPPGATLLPRHSPVPEHWIAAWPDVQRKLLGTSRILLALDFDGVAEASIPRSQEAILPEDLRHLLLKLQASPSIALALLSSRSLRDLRARANLGDVIYAGNHGMEVSGAGFACTDGLASSCRSDLVDVLSFLNRYARRFPGVVIEDKGLSISVHWRLAEETTKQKLEELLAAPAWDRARSIES